MLIVKLMDNENCLAHKRLDGRQYSIINKGDVISVVKNVHNSFDILLSNDIGFRIKHKGDVSFGVIKIIVECINSLCETDSYIDSTELVDTLSDYIEDLKEEN